MTKENSQTVGTARDSLASLVAQMRPQIANVLPLAMGMSPDRFTRIVVNALSMTPKLAECSKGSFVAAMMDAAALGLEPNTPLGQAYLLPYWNNAAKQMECRFQIGYAGRLALFYRAGGKDVEAHKVCEHDEKFDYESGLSPKLSHVRALTGRGKPIGYYAVWHSHDGGQGVAFMGIDEIIDHMNQYSKSAGNASSAWQTSFDEMAKKTVILKALKYAPMAAEAIQPGTAGQAGRGGNVTSGLVDGNSMRKANQAIDAVPPNVDPVTGEILDAGQEATA